MLVGWIGPRVRPSASQGEIRNLRPRGLGRRNHRALGGVTRMLDYGKTNGDFAVYHLLLAPSPFTSPTAVSGVYV